MQHTSISISFFAIIFGGLIVLAIGLGALKLLSLLVNALLGRGKPQKSMKVGAWSGIVTALAVTATVFIGLGIVAMLFYARTESRPHTVTVRHREQPGQIIVHTEGIFSGSADMIEPPEPPRHPEPPRPLERIVITRGGELIIAAEGKQPHQAAEFLAEAAEDAAVEPVVVDSEVVVTTTDTKVDPTAEQTASIDASKAELDQLVSKIGLYVNSNLEKVGDTESATVFGQAAKSDNGDVVVIQPSDEMVRQILGAAGQDLLKSFNSRLPGRIQQTYALIPLTPPVGSTVPVNPLLAAGGLKTIANSIVAFVESVESTAALAANNAENADADAAIADVDAAIAIATGASFAEAVGELTVQPEIPATPKWMEEADGRGIVVKTKPILSGDDAEALLTVAINEALAKHVQDVTANMNSTLREQAKFVCLELPQETARKYVVDTYDRAETLETETEGPQNFQIRYALLEFPEAVDQLAVQQIRKSIQQDRIFGLGLVVGFAWLSVCSAGFGIRQWRKGTRLRRIAAAPVFAVITLPTLLSAVGMVIALSTGEEPHRPMRSQPVSIDLQNI